MSIDLSLDRVQKLFLLLPYTRPTIHVAGTNGKGSVTAILSSVFTASGVSVGRFNSPHLIDLWDSININGCSVSEDMYRSVRESVERVDSEKSIKATKFEILTVTAAQIFEKLRVDVAIFEVGLGGKDDATNALPDNAILVSAITSVDLDHQLFLGNSPAAIARVKAGIARPGKTCILAVQKHAEVEVVVRDVVETIGGAVANAIDVTPCSPAKFLSSSIPYSQTVTARIPPWDAIDLEFRLPGAHQLQNLATALTIISILLSHRREPHIDVVLSRITPSTLGIGVLETKWPGRLEYVRLVDPPLTILVDGAHNPASATALQAYLTSLENSQENSPTHIPRTFVLALSHSPPKTPFETLSPLLRPGDRVALVNFSDVQDMPWVKNVPFPELETVVRSLVEGGDVHLFRREATDLSLEPLRRAIHWASSPTQREVVVLAGSLYLVADLYRIARKQGIS